MHFTLMEVFNTLEYKLKFMLDSMTLKLVDVKDIANKDRLYEFNDLYSNSTKLQLFCKNISTQTMFPVMGVPLATDDTIHTVTLCEVAFSQSIYVGKSFVDQGLPVPNGFDSLVTDMSENQVYLPGADLNKFQYVIADHTRIMPLYELTFEYDPVFEKNARNKNICHKCQKDEAIVYCPSERASFCGKCDEDVHSNSFLKRHERKYFAECGVSKFINCADHATKTVEFYCVDCGKPLCSYCKMTGEHGQIDFANHNIISFPEACNLHSKHVEETQDVMDGHIKSVAEELIKFKSNGSTSQANMSKIRSQLEREFKNLMLRLDNIESNKIQMYNANMIEMCRHEKLLNMMKIFPGELDPTDKVQYYKAIASQRQVNSYPNVAVEEFTPVELVGKISVKEPVNTGLRVSNSISSDKCVQMRIEAQSRTNKK